ncbi:MAG: L,D-transpeptidase [Myxococcales bacterium]|nr:L,D-transpeptidase [Myxococcales bacterium]
MFGSEQQGKPAKKITLDSAEARGLTVIDLGNDWVPYIFSEKTAGVEDHTVNDYRARYIGLANNRVDDDGEKLRAHERNFLELYGIPPTLGVIYREWQEAEAEVQSCLEKAEFDPAVFTRFQGTIAYKGKNSGKKRLRSARYYQQRLDKAMRKKKIAKGDYAAAAEHPELARLHSEWREVQNEVDVIDHAQRRFRCEKLFVGNKGAGKFEKGVYDSPTTHALARFEKKHNIMGWGHFKRDNLDMLGRSQAESMHQRLLRVVEERTVSAAGILEDGSAAAWRKDFRWKDAAGKEHKLRDLSSEATEAVIKALDLATPERARKALDALSDLGGGDEPFAALLIAVELPPLPEYYGPDMKFDVLIDRGDIWYDLPFDDEGNAVSQPRQRTPRWTLYTTYREQHIPIVHWRTTIGSWRNEVHDDGQVYYKYKNSDVGPRVWKEIVAAPTWIPPASTPPAELLKKSYKDGKFATRVNYDEMGPGYKSAYGLVAAYHIKEVFDSEGNWKADFDNGIRTHGSVDYMSILRRYSHGCHRLYNMNAVRLFSFVLRHREFAREGETPLGFGRKINYEGKEYQIRLKSRGYKYRLAEPIPVEVTKGRIRGKRKAPYEDFIKKPGVEYVAPGEEGVDGEEPVEGGEGVDVLTPIAEPPTPAG